MGRIGEWATPTRIREYLRIYQHNNISNMPSKRALCDKKSAELNKKREELEIQLQKAVKAIKEDSSISIRTAAIAFTVPRNTLARRLKGIKSKQQTRPKAQNLTESEELALTEHLITIAARGFPANIRDLEDLANRILRERGAKPVGKLWAYNFSDRNPRLKKRMNRRYDYQRAKSEDPKIIKEWFELYKSTILRYGVLENDVYNFDETGFQMGVTRKGVVITGAEDNSKAKSLQPGNREWATVIEAVSGAGETVPPYIIFSGKQHLSSLYTEKKLPETWRISFSESGWTNNEASFDWLKHFNESTKFKTKGTHRLLVFDGHKSHSTMQFHDYCIQEKILTLCLPPHSSHLLQPLDVGCFAPLKSFYGREIEKFMRSEVVTITKLEFLPAFIAAHKASMTVSNVKGAFRGAGLIPFNPEKVLSKLDIRAITPPENPPSRPSSQDNWAPKTPANPIELKKQVKLVRNRIVIHGSSSPTSLLEAVDQLIKGQDRLIADVTILKMRSDQIQAEKDAQKERKQRKRRVLQTGGSLRVDEARDLIEGQEIDAQIQQDTRSLAGGRRVCRNCGTPGHNIRTCKAPVQL